MTLPKTRLRALIAATLPAILISAGALQAQTPATPEPVTTFALDNGMQVVVVEDHRAPVVQHMVWYRTGSADEPKGASGVAHFLEHLLFKATDTLVAVLFYPIISNILSPDPENPIRETFWDLWIWVLSLILFFVLGRIGNKIYTDFVKRSRGY